MTPLHVTHVISGDLWAGSEVATYHLLCALAAHAELRVRAIVLNPGTLADRLRAAGVSVQVIAERGQRFARLALHIRRAVAGADLLHAHRYKENLLAALSGRPWLATQHGRPEQTQGWVGLRAGAYRALDWLNSASSARRVIAVSSEVERWVSRRVGQRRTVHCWNGIAEPPGAAAAARWCERPLRFGALGRLFPVKGFELAIRAVAACPGAELEVVGEGPERAALERCIRASGAAGRIRLVGHDPDPLARVARWRALLVTSHHEGNPISALEALALGTPIVSADLAGIREILAGRGGLLLPDRDPAAWGARLAAFLSDTALGARCSEQARERFREAFSARAAAQRVARIYADVRAELAGAPRAERRPPSADGLAG